MTDSILPREHALKFLTMLSSDDGFRGRYERNPATALAEFVPADILAQVPAANLKPVHLADKKIFADALQQLRNDTAEVCLCLRPPNVRLTLGN